MEGKKKGLFSSPIFRTRLKSASVKLFPEGALGYLVGPTLALLANSILSSYFNRYMTDIMGVMSWAAWFANWLPVISVAFVILGNILVGRLMDKNASAAGKARPLILLSIPVSVIALVVLFVLPPFANGTATQETQILALVLIAIGYNLWFAFAYPLYYTPHAALVNLSTRNSKDRSLLATISNATALAAMGISSMILPFFLGLLFVDTGAVDAAGNAVLDQVASYQNWKIFVVALIIITFLGAVIEFFFTRERVSEEALSTGLEEKKGGEPLKKQISACVQDKFWWIMIAFFFLYQFGGMIKNVSIGYYCSALFPIDGKYSTANGGVSMGLISIIGAIPTSIGMLLCFPLSNKIGKGKSILFGAVLAVIGGVIGLIDPSNLALVITSFVVKALGSTPAMYLSLALLADVLDHQEAKNGFRTDGFTMTVYGAIMAGMTGIATGVLNIVLSSVGYSPDALNTPALQTATTWLFTGGETVCYALIFILFFFMGVEKFSKDDHARIVERQKQAAIEAGVEWVSPEEKLRREEEEAILMSEEARKAELKAKCERKGLSFDEEEAKYQAKKQEKLAKKQAKLAKKRAKDENQDAE